MTPMPGIAPVKHLHNEHDITFQLLADPTAWRERVVEKIAIEDADDVRVTSSYQLRLPLRLVQTAWPACKSGDLVRLLLPLTTRPKGVLLDVDLQGLHGHHCQLLLKHQLARLQSDYIAWVAARRSDSHGPFSDQPLMYAISAYSASIWEAHATFGNRSGERRMSNYLSDGLGLAVEQEAVRDLRAAVQPIEEELAKAAPIGRSMGSAAENLLRCLPFAESSPRDIDEVFDWIEQLRLTVDSIDYETRREISGYGRHWDVIVDTTVPVDVPTKVQLSTKRPWHDPVAQRSRLPIFQNTAAQRVMLGDAQSAHAEIHLNDHGVRLAARPRLRAPDGRSVKIPAVDAVRWTDDTISVYASGDDAPAFVDLSVLMALRSPMRAFLWLLVGLGAVSIAVALAFDAGDLLAEAPALLVVPIAGSILLSRPATGVAERLQRRLRGTILFVALCICAVLVARWATRTIAPGEEPKPTAAVSSAARFTHEAPRSYDQAHGTYGSAIPPR